MELRSAEDEVQAMQTLYQSLRRTKISSSSSNDEDITKLSARIQSLSEIASTQERIADGDDDGNETPFLEERSATTVLSMLESLELRLKSLKPKMDRFRKRSKEKDPVTDAPRYGEKTMSRVTNLLLTYDALTAATVTVLGVAVDTNDEDEPTITATSPSTNITLVDDIRRQVENEQEAARQAQLQEEQRRLQEQAERVAEGERRRQEQVRQEEAAREARLAQEQEWALRAQAVRQARQEAEQAERRAREAAERADREWVASVTKGPGGVRQQLQVLQESTVGEPGAYSVALNALHTLFSQIVAHPEQVNFRRVRRDHPRFHQDIGRHRGGRELLIAAGFRLGAIDDIPCFISTEPDIEKDMDGWSVWFNLLKATLQIVEEELIK